MYVFNLHLDAFSISFVRNPDPLIVGSRPWKLTVSQVVRIAFVLTAWSHQSRGLLCPDHQ